LVTNQNRNGRFNGFFENDPMANQLKAKKMNVFK
jgi:hypothetical protein